MGLDTLAGDVATVKNYAEAGQASSGHFLVGHFTAEAFITAAGTDEPRCRAGLHRRALAPDADENIAEASWKSFPRHKTVFSHIEVERRARNGCCRKESSASQEDLIRGRRQKVVWATHFAPGAADLFQPQKAPMA